MMLVPPETPCPDCGHPRSDHDLSEEFVEQCLRCGCRAAASETTPVFWEPEGEPKPFDWRFALITFLMCLENHEDLFVDSIHEWRPPYDLREGEIDDLRSVETTVRFLWDRYGPKRPGPARLHERSVEADNADVDAFEERKHAFWSALLRLPLTDEWRAFFPQTEHERIEHARKIITARGGADRLEELM